MSESIELRREGKNIDVKLIIESRPVADYIFKVAPIVMFPSDTLSVTVNLDIYGFVNDAQTSHLNEKYEYIVESFTEMKKVQYIRFTKHLDNASIQVYETLPTDFYNPPTWNAKKKP